MRKTAFPVSRLEALRQALQPAVDSLHHRRAADIPPGFIEDFVALHWLEWDAGGLRLTITGENICRQARA